MTRDRVIWLMLKGFNFHQLDINTSSGIKIYWTLQWNLEADYLNSV